MYGEEVVVWAAGGSVVRGGGGLTVAMVFVGKVL
jgi:hypothetical protein